MNILFREAELMIDKIEKVDIGIEKIRTPDYKFVRLLKDGFKNTTVAKQSHQDRLDGEIRIPGNRKLLQNMAVMRKVAAELMPKPEPFPDVEKALDGISEIASEMYEFVNRENMTIKNFEVLSRYHDNVQAIKESVDAMVAANLAVLQESWHLLEEMQTEYWKIKNELITEELEKQLKYLQ